MPLIDTTTLLRVADRAAYQYGQIISTMAAISQTGLGLYWETVSATQDVDVEVPTEGPYEEVDDDLSPVLVARTGSRLSNVIYGMDAHFDRRDSNGNPLQIGGWDGYLSSKNKRVSYYFAELYYAIKGAYMYAMNVFSEGNDKFADVGVIAGPAISFVDGINYGNGAALNPANGTYFAATQLKVVVVTMGGTNLDLRISVKDINNNPTTIDVTVPAGSIPGAVISIGTTASRFLDVIGAAFVPAGSQGTVGDAVEIRNLKERQIQL